MQLIPALDIMGGSVVRLRQGLPGTETVYAKDPLAVARSMVRDGAGRLHVIDLDRALSTGRDNRRLVWRVVESAGIPVQVGGGLRSTSDIDEALEKGADVIISTSLFDGGGETVARRYGNLCRSGTLMASLDDRSGAVAVSGWSAVAPLTTGRAVTLLGKWGFRRVVYTDTGRDGLLTGPGHPAALLEAGLEVIVAGGVRDVDDLLALQAAGFHGAIVGRAIYDGTVDIAAAVATLARGRGLGPVVKEEEK